MKPRDFRELISKLPEAGRHTAKLEEEIGLRRKGRSTWYRSQKEHWLGWLDGYNGPGAYGRKNWAHDAEYIYDHIQCSPMLLWLGEALGVSESILKKASRAAAGVGRNGARQCAAVRKEMPWITIAVAINNSDYYLSKEDRKKTDAYKRLVGTRKKTGTVETPEFKKATMEYILDTFGRDSANETFGPKYVDDVLNLRPVKRKHPMRRRQS